MHTNHLLISTRHYSASSTALRLLRWMVPPLVQLLLWCLSLTALVHLRNEAVWAGEGASLKPGVVQKHMPKMISPLSRPECAGCLAARPRNHEWLRYRC